MELSMIEIEIEEQNKSMHLGADAEEKFYSFLSFFLFIYN
jgi:hypothetical protein